MKLGVLLLALATMAMAATISQSWSFSAQSQVNALAIGNGVGVASSCAYVIEGGSTVYQNCTAPSISVSAYGSSLFFTTQNGYVLQVNGDGATVIPLGSNFTGGIAPINDIAFVACYSSCGLFVNGTLKWRYDNVTVLSNPEVVGSTVFVPDTLSSSIIVLNLSDGNMTNSIKLPEIPWDIASCSNYLAIKTATTLYLYSTNGTLIWEMEKLGPYGGVAFGPNCKYLAVGEGTNLHVFYLNGTEVLEMQYPLGISSVAWKDDELVVGFFDGTVYAYNINITALSLLLTPITSSEGVSGVPGPALLAFPLIAWLRRRYY